MEWDTSEDPVKLISAVEPLDVDHVHASSCYSNHSYNCLKFDSISKSSLDNYNNILPSNGSLCCIDHATDNAEPDIVPCCLDICPSKSLSDVDNPDVTQHPRETSILCAYESDDIYVQCFNESDESTLQTRDITQHCLNQSEIVTPECEAEYTTVNEGT